jgi:MraZ protein
MLLLTGEYQHVVDGKSRVLISNKLRSQIDADEHGSKAVAFERISFALASKVELDAQGRLLLNERLRKRAGLKDRITLVGVRDHIELWNNENWEQYLADNMAQYQKQMSQARQVVLQEQSEEL